MFFYVSIVKRTIEMSCGDSCTRDVTVIVNNFARPHNLHASLDKMKELSHVKDVIVLHGNPDTYTPFEGVKNVKHFEMNEKFGAANRFYGNEHVTTPYVMFVDDDVLPSNHTMEYLHKEVVHNPKTIHGPFGRTCNASGYANGGPPDTVLTKALMTSKDVIDDYLSVFGSKYEDYLTITHGNGEDLTLNHFVKSTGQDPNPVRASLNGTVELDGSNGYSTNADGSRKPEHYKLRDKFCKTMYRR